ncbi:alpha/beta hydrolase [Streptomyces antibioticus]|uniref:Alpha/beta hydrolase n=1 Tax=Streptomyces antibioticus TaxID=1890 RepID=A0AAE7CNU5_STRAT|nr:alpha/beta hydrolase [Streptomyces antibioticus]OOQ47814.1 alpha/beta hydrolase [Streptomyces antibioticus]QIT48141.1 alpha/beta hydrolase [Streptomyces antibioticus]
MTEYTDHHGPEGLLVRGTVVVVPGRGETRATYGRFGRRLAADAYRVRVVDAPRPDAADPEGALTRFAALVADAVAGAAGAEGVAEPVVLVGADSGAAAVAALLAREERFLPAGRPHAVVLAGLPGPDTAFTGGGWDDELDARTSCPAHRGTLTGDEQVRRGSLGEPVPGALLDAAYGGDIAVPVLLLAGDADPLADHPALARLAKALPKARLSVVRGAHHDVLNDLQHRSVAAEVVTFLETLRNELRPLVAVESSAW